MHSEVVNLCRELIESPSINPGNSSHFTSPYGEEEISRFIFEWLKKSGANVEMQHLDCGRMNVVASAEGIDKSRTIILCSHMDTVGIDGMLIDPFAGKISNGRIYGRGACDDKGPLASMLIAFRDYIQGDKLPCNVVLLASCGEEVDLRGSRHYVENNTELPTVIIVGEPTNLKPSISHKGILRFSVRTLGQNAHSSTPEQGKNSIYLMGQVIGVIEEFSKILAAKPKHNLLNTETLAVTMIVGGEGINTIPANCEVQIDWRILPGRTKNECFREIIQYLNAHFNEPFALKLISHFNPMETDINHVEVERFCDVCRALNLDIEITSQPYMTDASAWSNKNIPIIVFGPGDPAQAHTSDEFISITQLEQAVLVYKLFLR